MYEDVLGKTLMLGYDLAHEAFMSSSSSQSQQSILPCLFAPAVWACAKYAFTKAHYAYTLSHDKVKGYYHSLNGN